MAVLPAIMGGLEIGANIFGALNARREAQEAKRALQRMDTGLEDATAGLSVETAGAEMALREQSRAVAGALSTLERSGQRGAVAGVQDVVLSSQEGTNRVEAGLQEQRSEINRLKSLDAIRRRELLETRRQNQIAGLGTEMATEEANFGAHLTGIFGSLGTMLGELEGTEEEQAARKKKRAEKRKAKE